MNDHRPPLQPTQRASWLRRHARLIKALLAAALLVAVALANDISLTPETLDGLTQAAWLLPAVLLSLVVAPLLGVSRWRVFLRYVGVSERRFPLFRIVYFAAFFAALLPSTLGADVVRMVLIERRHPGSRGRTSATVIGERLLGFILLCGFGLAGAVAVRRQGEASSLVWVMAGLMAGLLFILYVLSHPRTARTVAAALALLRLPSVVIEFVTAGAEALADLPLRRVLPRALPYMILYQLSVMAMVACLFLAIGVALPFHVHVAFFPVIAIITILPVTIGGLGLREGAFVHFYGLAGVSADTAFTVSLLFFLTTGILGAAVGGLWALLENVRGEDLAEVSREAAQEEMPS